MGRPKKDKANLFVKVTISLPRHLRVAAKKEQTNRKIKFSKIVAEALSERYMKMFVTEIPISGVTWAE